METNTIYCGDCLVKLKDILDESIDLIYIDPPFSSNRNYVAFWKEQEKRHFEDRFEDVQAYLDYMRPRLKELYRVLKTTGSFYYHCDWHASHYIKVLLDSDYLFGYANFKSEIIWKRTNAHNDPFKYGNIHDMILFYSKSKNYTWNTLYTPYTKEYIESEWIKLPSGRYYKSENMLDPRGKMNEYDFMGTTARWRTNLDGMMALWNAEQTEVPNSHGRIKLGKDGMPTKRCRIIFLDEMPGVPLQTLWDDINSLRGGSTERLGYPTQKPVALLERIINTSSNKGGIVLDAFCGCGTTLIASEKLKRKWIGMDISPTACRIMAQRLEKGFLIKEGKDFFIKDMPKTVEELRQYPAFEFQNWAVNALGGVASKMKVRDMGIDGKLYPIEDIQKSKKEGMDLFGEIDRYIPIQVKRTDQVGRPDIENFAIAIKRDNRNKGIFVGFDFSRDADKEIRRIKREENIEIEKVTVNEILEKQLDKQLK